MFDSPLQWCPVVKAWVALDQTQQQCAWLNGCGIRVCPLANVLLREQLDSEEALHEQSASPR